MKILPPDQVSNVFEQALSGNNAALSTLALRETLFAIGLNPHEQVEDFNRICEGTFVDVLVQGVAISPMKHDDKITVFQNIADALDSQPGYVTSGRSRILSNLSVLQRDLLSPSALFKNNAMVLSDRVFNLQVDCRRNLTRLSREKRLEKLLSSSGFMDKIMPDIMYVLHRYEQLESTYSRR